MFEIDPYLDITLFSEGIHPGNIEAFCLETGALDLLVEECDDLHVKVLLREVARAHKIPVVMETSDRGLLDVERFDREPERPILHGLVGDVVSERLRGLTTKEKVPYVLRIIDERAISVGLAASLVEVKESICTWPQLGSAVTLGGAAVTDVARRLLLGTFTDSGRYYVDFETIVKNGAPQPPPPDTPFESAVAAEAVRPRAVAPPISRGSEAPSRDEIRWLIAHAILAPSGGNAQPWRFVFEKEELAAWIDGDASYLDFERVASHLALGAAAENLDLAARAIGLAATIRRRAGSVAPAARLYGNVRPLGGRDAGLVRVGHTSCDESPAHQARPARRRACPSPLGSSRPEGRTPRAHRRS
jgi:hypothetical protein